MGPGPIPPVLSPQRFGSRKGVSAVPGYELYYLNVMAGPTREWLITFDPDHAWLSAPPGGAVRR